MCCVCVFCVFCVCAVGLIWRVVGWRDDGLGRMCDDGGDGGRDKEVWDGFT